MASVVDIYNLALANVGVTIAVQDVDEASAEAEVCRRFYDLCRDQVLRDFNWDFARRYTTLGLVAEEPVSEWGYSYRYPSDCIKVRRIVSGNRKESERVPFVLGSDSQGKLIYTDQLDAVAETTVRITDTELFDANMTIALSWLLAHRIAKPLSRSDGERDAAFKMYLLELSTAETNAGNETGNDPAPEAESIRARG